MVRTSALPFDTRKFNRVGLRFNYGEPKPTHTITIAAIARLCEDSKQTSASSAKSMTRRVAHIVTVAPPWDLVWSMRTKHQVPHRGVDLLVDNRHHRCELHDEKKRDQQISLTEALVDAEAIGILAVV